MRSSSECQRSLIFEFKTVLCKDSAPSQGQRLPRSGYISIISTEIMFPSQVQDSRASSTVIKIPLCGRRNPLKVKGYSGKSLRAFFMVSQDRFHNVLCHRNLP